MNTNAQLRRPHPRTLWQGANEQSGQGFGADVHPVQFGATAHSANLPFVYLRRPTAALVAGLRSQCSLDAASSLTDDLRGTNQDELDRGLRIPGLDVSKTSTEDTTPLMLSVTQGDLPAMQNLLARPELDVNGRNQQGNTALHLAVLSGHVNQLDTLLGDARMDPNVPNFAGDTALCLAAQHDCDEALEHLLDDQDRHINLSEQPTGEYLKAFRMAADNNAFRVIPILLNAMPWLQNTIRTDGHTVLSAAIKAGRLDPVRMLLKLYPDLDVNLAGEGLGTALNVAAAERNAEMVLALLGHPGLDPNVHLSQIGTTVLHLAASRGDANIVQALMSAWPVINVNARTRQGETPLHIAAYHGDLDALRVLAPRVDNINQSDEAGWTALHYGAACGKVDVVQFLLQLPGIDLVPFSLQDKTPADVAIKLGHAELARILRRTESEQIALRDVVDAFPPDNA